MFFFLKGGGGVSSEPLEPPPWLRVCLWNVLLSTCSYARGVMFIIYVVHNLCVCWLPCGSQGLGRRISFFRFLLGLGLPPPLLPFYDATCLKLHFYLGFLSVTWFNVIGLSVCLQLCFCHELSLDFNKA